MLAPVLITAPTETPVTLAEAKAHCRVDFSTDDALITSLIEAATAHLDGHAGVLGRALITQTWAQKAGEFSTRLRLPLAPIAEVASVTYFDGSNVEQALATSVYDLFTDARGPYLALKPGQDWPGVYDRPDAVTVTFICGEPRSSVPAAIKAAILMLVAHWYANREAVTASTQQDLPYAVDALLRPYRRVGV